MAAPRNFRRPRAEVCDRLHVGVLRPQVQPPAPRHRLADGTDLELRWQPVKGCWGGGSGIALVIACPICGSSCRVLWSPPAQGWGCWRCCPVSHASHRRSGRHGGRGKPTSWQRERIAAEQQRIADLLGLEWPLRPLVWVRADLDAAPRKQGAPRLSARRDRALRRRMDALETLRVDSFCGPIRRLSGDRAHAPQDPAAEVARRVLAATAWAMRRPAGDPRHRRL